MAGSQLRVVASVRVPIEVVAGLIFSLEATKKNARGATEKEIERVLRASRFVCGCRVLALSGPLAIMERLTTDADFTLRRPDGRCAAIVRRHCCRR